VRSVDQVLAVVALLASGLVAGVFMAVAVSVLPTLFALPTAQYVVTHRLLGRGYHPVMPIVVSCGTVADLVLLLRAPDTGTAVLRGVAFLALAGVQLVSQLLNVPINKAVHRVDLDALDDTWPDPRPAWRRWHRLRTALAFVAFVANAVVQVAAAGP
jgi:uncharacterized membrane protein